jgi:FkbM family methyltransferase
MNVKQLAKEILLKTCSPRMRHGVRRAYVVHRIMRNQHYREPEMALIRKLVQNGDAALDAGANVGVYTSELALAVGSLGKVYSFEPVAENYDILTALIQKAHLHNVFPYRAALGATSGECQFVVPDMNGFTGYYWAHEYKPGDRGKSETVNMTTIDELRQSGAILPLNFIKCDVEGGELGVVLGAQQAIRSNRPGWLIEVSRDTSREVFDALHDFGYRALVLEDGLRETEGYLDHEFSNYFFLHPQSPCWERARPR